MREGEESMGSLVNPSISVCHILYNFCACFEFIFSVSLFLIIHVILGCDRKMRMPVINAEAQELNCRIYGFIFTIPWKIERFLEDLFLGSQWSIILGYRRLSVKFFISSIINRSYDRNSKKSDTNCG